MTSKEQKEISFDIENDSLRQRIEKKAYMLFLKRGGKHGYDLYDWLEAERIVKKALESETSEPPTDRVTNFRRPHSLLSVK